MYKILLLFIFISSLMTPVMFGVSDNTVTVAVTQSEPGSNGYDEGKKKRRCRPIIETCILDFNSNEIISSILFEIISYEVWDNAGDSLIASFSDDSDAILFLSRLNGTYQIRFVTESSTYVGYVDL